MAELRKLIVQLESAARGEIEAAVAAELAKAMRPFQPAVRAAIINIPTYGEKHTGLRLRIANCVQTWVVINGPVVQAGVEVNAAKMPDGQKALPLYMDGAKAPWRHPVYGHRDNWVEQEAHPYFAGAVSDFGPATARAVERAMDVIAAKITG
jgi:hypothetical protein